MSDTPTLAPTASAKRRALLKGASVAAAGGAPLVAMATTGQRLVTSTGKSGTEPIIVCSLSGWQSLQNARQTGQYKGGAFLSGTPGTYTCGGYSPGWWGQTQQNRWTGGMADLKNVDYTTCLPHSPVIMTATETYTRTGTNRFAWVKVARVATAFEIMTKLKENKPGNPNVGDKFSYLDIGNNSVGDIWHWLGAWLNARSNEVSYPYTANDNFPFSSQQVTSLFLEGNTDALNFIKTYMETHS